MSTTFDLDISVSEHATSTRFTATTEGNELTGITMKLTPEDGLRVAVALTAELAPVIAWRRRPLYEWAKRKTGQAEG